MYLTNHAFSKIVNLTPTMKIIDFMPMLDDVVGDEVILVIIKLPPLIA